MMKLSDYRNSILQVHYSDEDKIKCIQKLRQKDKNAQQFMDFQALSTKHKTNFPKVCIVSISFIVLCAFLLFTFQHFPFNKASDNNIPSNNVTDVPITVEPSTAPMDYPILDGLDMRIDSTDFHLSNYYITQYYNYYISDGTLYYKEEQSNITHEKDNNETITSTSLSFHTLNTPIANDVIHFDYNDYLVYLTSDFKLYGLGRNYNNILLEDANALYPETISSPKLLMNDVAYVRCTDQNIVVLKTDGDVYMWGIGNDQTPMKEPMKILQNAIFIACGTYKCCAIKNDHTLWTWDSADLVPQQVAENIEMVWSSDISFNITDRSLIHLYPSLYGQRPNIIYMDDKKNFYYMSPFNYDASSVYPIHVSQLPLISNTLWSELSPDSTKQDVIDLIEKHELSYTFSSSISNHDVIELSLTTIYDDATYQYFEFDETNHLICIGLNTGDSFDGKHKLGDSLKSYIDDYGENYELIKDANTNLTYLQWDNGDYYLKAQYSAYVNVLIKEWK